VARPHSDIQVKEIMIFAHTHNLPVRTRGRGHSANSTALPRKNELLLSTENLNTAVVLNDSIIDVGSGVSVHGLNNWLRQYGYFLPVVNGGGAGPSVGGFISASGIGPNSSVYGGFWDQVLEITLISGKGEIFKVSREDSLFKWVFGSMGQLGVIAGARLRIISAGTGVRPLPESAVVSEEWSERYDGPRMVNPRIAELTSQGMDLRVFWFIMIGPWKFANQYQKSMHELFVRYSERLYLEPNYNWKISRQSFIPPLFSVHDESLICTGPWGVIPAKPDSAMFDALLQLEDEFVRLVDLDSSVSRYIQAERVGGGFDFESYFPKATVNQFRVWKKKLDPKHVLNRGSFFKYLDN
jgi:FAD/FMN-containing dehydrogenase